MPVVYKQSNQPVRSSPFPPDHLIDALGKP
jgi:hypothetical protein